MPVVRGRPGEPGPAACCCDREGAGRGAVTVLGTRPAHSLLAEGIEKRASAKREDVLAARSHELVAWRAHVHDARRGIMGTRHAGCFRADSTCARACGRSGGGAAGSDYRSRSRRCMARASRVERLLTGIGRWRSGNRGRGCASATDRAPWCSFKASRRRPRGLTPCSHAGSWPAATRHVCGTGRPGACIPRRRARARQRLRWGRALTRCGGGNGRCSRSVPATG